MVDKRQLNIRLEKELYDFVIESAEKNFMSVTGFFKKLILDLYKEEKKKNVN